MQRNRFRSIVWIVALVAAWPTLAAAQVVGSIAGTVTDQSGQPLQGVRLTARSETQIGGNKTAFSNEEGFFRIPGLQPGAFEVRAVAPHLKTVIQKGVHVGLNAPADVDLMMEVESAVEEVKIVERAPVVSTTSATVKEVFDADFVDGLPMTKRTGYGGFIRDTVPGAADGGPNPAIGDWTARVRGANNAQNAVMLEGFLVNGQKVTLNSLAAMEVQSGASGAENAGTPGAAINMVTMSGSNKVVFDVTTWHEDSRLRLFLDRTDPGNGVMNTFVNPALSGPIIKDKLWFYANVEGRYNPTERDPDPTGVMPTPPPRKYWNGRGTLKLTWQINPRNKIQTFTLINREEWLNYREGWDVAKEAQMKRDWFDYFTGATWESLLGDSVFFKSQIGYQRFFRVEVPELCATEPDSCLDVMPREQLYPRRLYQGNYDRVDQLVDSSVEFTNTLEGFAHHRWLGDHDVKLVARTIGRIYETTSGVPSSQKDIYNDTMPARHQWFYSNDPRYDTQAHTGYWIRASSGLRVSTSLSDVIRLGRFVTVTPGLALTVNRAGNNQVGDIISQVAVTPHLSVVWDLTQDGRTVLRASHNQYIDTDAVRIARQGLDDGVMKECSWDASTGAYTSNCRYSGGARGRTVGMPCGTLALNIDGTPCRAEKLVAPRTYEVTLGGEREVVAGVGLGLDFIYRRFTHPYEKAETNRIWNVAGDALSPLSGYRNGRAELVTDLETPAGAGRRYTGVTVSLKKREGALKMTASYTWSQLEGNVFLEEDNDYGDIGPRNAYLWGYSPLDRRHELRTSAVYQVTPWFSAGVNYNYYSGSPYSQRFLNGETGKTDDLRARTGVGPGPNLNDPGDDRPLSLPDLQQLNIQLRANLRPLLGLNLETYLDVLNALGARTTTAVVTDAGPNFGAIATRMDPFRLRLGLRFRY